MVLIVSSGTTSSGRRTHVRRFVSWALSAMAVASVVVPWFVLLGGRRGSMDVYLPSSSSLAETTATTMHDCTKTQESLVLATQQQEQQTHQQQCKNLLTLPGQPAPHATFTVVVGSSSGDLAKDFESTPRWGGDGFSFLFPKECNGILNWITQSSPQEKKIIDLFVTSFQEAIQQQQQAKALQDRPLFVDVGSNCGFYTLLAAQMGMQVHAYDLQPACVQHVAAGATVNGWRGRIQVFLAGMSNRQDTLFEFSSFESGCFGGFPVLKERGKDTNPKEKVRVPLLSMDAQYDQTTPISFLKADTEGNEIKVLQGALHNFETKNIHKAIVEFTPMFWKKRGYPHDDAMTTLCQIQSFGYRLSWHLNNQQLPDCESIKAFFNDSDNWERPVSRDILFEALLLPSN